MLEVILLCAIGCLFFMIASIRFKKKLAMQEEEMANLRATRRQEARDRELAMEEFLDIQERCRLDLIHQHFEFHTIPSSPNVLSPEGNIVDTKEVKQNEGVKNRKISDMDKTHITLSSSYDDTDDDEENQHQKEESTSANNEPVPVSIQMVESVDANHKHDGSSELNLHVLADSQELAPSNSEQQQQEDTLPIPSARRQSNSPDDVFSNTDVETTDTPTISNTTNETNKSNNTGILPSWLTTTICRPPQQQQQHEEEDDDCCCICLESYQPNETVCWAKKSTYSSLSSSSLACHHVFHKECALQWFMGNFKHNQCPMCRITLLPDSTAQEDASSIILVEESDVEEAPHEQQHGR